MHHVRLVRSAYSRPQTCAHCCPLRQASSTLSNSVAPSASQAAPLARTRPSSLLVWFPGQFRLHAEQKGRLNCPGRLSGYREGPQRELWRPWTRRPRSGFRCCLGQHLRSRWKTAGGKLARHHHPRLRAPRRLSLKRECICLAQNRRNKAAGVT